MSIEKLEKAKEYFLNVDKFNDREAIDWFMKFTINIFKDQSDEIAELKKELAQKEDAIDIGDVIKEARLRNG